MPFSIKDAFASWIGWRASKTLKRLWRMIQAVIFWTLWKEKNCRVFDGISIPTSTLKAISLSTLFSWHFLFPVNSVDNFLDFVSSLTLA
ncbi:hypothetical protein MTR67_033662 [Solanum verrucosum]|uniref:Reverse transcriptase zinc-binding domain-containing protein n=1 Tax=Solanum verrucosum TaxID=315347 RepID=A0AAF0ZIF4_SOLVR|nr:hypothetical protein MTR67_033662 [Solanum verrucosum]